MAADRILEGCFAVNKPAGVTSAYVVSEVQSYLDKSRLFAPWLKRERERLMGESQYQRGRRRMVKRMSRVKTGHGGTLDPMATGVLILGVGKGTKSLPQFLGCTKSYETVVLFGNSTDTYDTTGKVLKSASTEHLTPELVRSKLDAFRGKVLQTPPIYSALHMDGKRLYEYAHAGKELPREIAKREVETTEMEMVEWMPAGSHEYRCGPGMATKKTEEFAEAIEKILERQDEGESVEDGGTSLKRKAPEQPSSEEQPKAKQAKVDGEPEGLVVTDANGATADGTHFPDHTAHASAPPNDAQPEDHPQAQASEPSTSALSSDPPLSQPAARIRMTVTSGFYVRSLAHDLGVAAGSVAAMASLVRTRQAHFEVGRNVLELDELKAGEEVWGPKLRGMLEDWEEAQDGARKSEAEVVESELGGGGFRDNPNARSRERSGERSGARSAERSRSRAGSDLKGAAVDTAGLAGLAHSNPGISTWKP